MTLLGETWFGWALALALGFPLSAVVLSELISLLERRGSALSTPLRALRNILVPVLVTLFFVRNVLGYPGNATLLKLLATLAWIVAIYVALSLLNALLFRNATQSSWRSKVPALFLDLSRFILILVGVAVVLSNVWGADLGGLLTALGVGSIVIGLALQDTLSNIFAGISILFERPYAEGDWIELEGTVGQVEAINWRATRLLTRDGDVIIIPNGVAANATILNETRSDAPAYEEYRISFSYNDPPNKVKRVLLETIRATHGVEPSPPPMVRTLTYDGYAINYQVRFSVDDYGQLPNVKDDFATRIWYAAQRSGLKIPYPIRTLYHYDGTKTDEEAETSALQQGLGQLEALVPLEPEETLGQVTLKHFGAGEFIIQEGEWVGALYTILSGNVQMSIEDKVGTRHEVTRLGPGELFGGVALLRGQVSSSAFSALDDVAVVTLSNDAIMTMVAQKPSFAREMEELIEARSSAERTVREGLLANQT